MSLPGTTHSTYKALEQLHRCVNPAELAALTGQLVRDLGATSFVYSIHVTDEDSSDQLIQRHSISSSAEWSNIYDAKKWFMNDVFVEYAKRNCSPAYGSQIAPQTQGQRDMLDMAGRFGFISGMLVPTHSSNNAEERIGMLYIGSDQPPATGEALMRTNRIVYRALAMELLDWWTEYLRRKAADKYKLNGDEIRLLQLSKNGCVVSDISARLSIKQSNLYRQFDVIKDKLNVHKIGEAVRKADLSGLLG